jgi:hypothetical protein
VTGILPKTPVPEGGKRTWPKEHRRLARGPALKILGNAVQPQQAELAVRALVGRAKEMEATS